MRLSETERILAEELGARYLEPEEFFQSSGEGRYIPLATLRSNPNALVAYIYFHLLPGMPPTELAKVRALYRGLFHTQESEKWFVRTLRKLREKHEPLFPPPDPPRGGPLACPICEAAIDADPEHWRISGRARCPVRAFLSKEEAVLELGALGATPESVEDYKIMDKPYIVNAGMAVLKGRRLKW